MPSDLQLTTTKERLSEYTAGRKLELEVDTADRQLETADHRPATRNCMPAELEILQAGIANTIAIIAD